MAEGYFARICFDLSLIAADCCRLSLSDSELVVVVAVAAAVIAEVAEALAPAILFELMSSD